jgi:CDP-diacylglycerol---glycerol-3-phosphate 3-phosphatidyltransferase
VIEPAPRRAASVWNVANALTALRLVLVPVFAWLLLRDGGHNTTWRLAATATFVVAGLTDRFDGELARRKGLITDVGKIADPIADKALMGTALVGLSVLGELPWWVTVVVLVRELGITVLRLALLPYGVMPAGRGGKLKTAVQALAIGLYLLPLARLPLPDLWRVIEVATMGVAVLLTVVTGVEYLVQAVRLVRSGRGTAAERLEPS